AVGAGTSNVTQSLGTVVHAIAAMATEDGTDYVERLDDIWDQFDFGGLWFNRKQRRVAEQMVDKFVRWQKDKPRDLVAVEEAFTVRVPGHDIQITGRVDRVERDEAGRAVI